MCVRVCARPYAQQCSPTVQASIWESSGLMRTPTLDKGLERNAMQLHAKNLQGTLLTCHPVPISFAAAALPFDTGGSTGNFHLTVKSPLN